MFYTSPGQATKGSGIQRANEALCEGDRDRFLTIVAESRDYIITNKYDNWTMLALAICHGDHELAEHLLSLGANPNHQLHDDENANMLSLACAHNDLEMINLLISYGADDKPRTKNTTTSTATTTGIKTAILTGNIRLAERLFEALNLCPYDIDHALWTIEQLKLGWCFKGEKDKGYMQGFSITRLEDRTRYVAIVEMVKARLAPMTADPAPYNHDKIRTINVIDPSIVIANWLLNFEAFRQLPFSLTQRIAAMIPGHNCFSEYGTPAIYKAQVLTLLSEEGKKTEALQYTQQRDQDEHDIQNKMVPSIITLAKTNFKKIHGMMQQVAKQNDTTAYNFFRRVLEAYCQSPSTLANGLKSFFHFKNHHHVEAVGAFLKQEQDEYIRARDFLKWIKDNDISLDKNGTLKSIIRCMIKSQVDSKIDKIKNNDAARLIAKI